jgi:hypothetical protein
MKLHVFCDLQCEMQHPSVDYIFCIALNSKVYARKGRVGNVEC